jgi:hypothetical protein
MIDPNRWQPLQIEHMISQNGIPVTNGVQVAIGTHWGRVTSFALASAGPNGVPIDPGPPPLLGDPATDSELKAQLVELIRDSSELDPANDATIDISPGARGGNTLGSNDGHGHAANPATGQPYASDVVKRADFGRVMAEFWADGPKSETPPGHWNVIANLVSDELAPNLRLGGTGPRVGRLQWDVKLYLALNGAVHDAAIAAWGLKGHYDSSRPISLIRYMGGLGQSSDPSLSSYDPEGLPLVPGLIELIERQCELGRQSPEYPGLNPAARRLIRERQPCSLRSGHPCFQMAAHRSNTLFVRGRIEPETAGRADRLKESIALFPGAQELGRDADQPAQRSNS